MQKLIKQIHSQAQHLGACKKLQGTEDLDGLVRLMKTPQGREFCLKHNFPSLKTFRDFNVSSYLELKHKVYLDSGHLKLINQKHIVLIGKVQAIIDCNKNEIYQITLMHGSKAIINASGWAVVSIDAGKDSSYTKKVSENAIVI